jgi:hypothetical protein
MEGTDNKCLWMRAGGYKLGMYMTYDIDDPGIIALLDSDSTRLLKITIAVCIYDL